MTSNLLHMAEDILTAVKNTLSLLWIQVEDEISGVIGIAVFISTRHVEGLFWQFMLYYYLLKWPMHAKYPIFSYYFKKSHLKGKNKLKYYEYWMTQTWELGLS